MEKLSKEQTARAVAILKRCVEFRGDAQSDLATNSGLAQSTVSKIFSDAMVPGTENLDSLFSALGMKLSNVLNESDVEKGVILGYLATPLTRGPGASNRAWLPSNALIKTPQRNQ